MLNGLKRARSAGVAITAAALVLAFASVAQATIESGQIDLLTDPSIRFDGANEGNWAGFSVASAGDVNGDGTGDLIVGAPRAGDNFVDVDPVPLHNGRQRGAVDITGTAEPIGRLPIEAGTTYVVFGGPSLPSVIDFRKIGDEVPGFRIEGGNPRDYSGLAVSGAGDVNGDGKDDVIIGAPYAKNGGKHPSGIAYVVLGKSDNTTVGLGGIGDAGNDDGFRIVGARDSQAWVGRSVAAAGDMNGDGKDDVVVGAPLDGEGGDTAGAAYVIRGKADTGANSTIDLANLRNDEGYKIRGGPSYEAGFSVGGAGDINGDGIPDVVIGAPCANNPDPLPAACPGNGAGAAFAVLGQGGSSDVSLTSLQGKGFRMDGERAGTTGAGDNAGFSVAGAGDVNDDGAGDLIVGAPHAEPGGVRDAGLAYVLLGKSGNGDIPLGSMDRDDGYRIAGASGGPNCPPACFGGEAGFAVSRAGDVNDDGVDDVIVGTPHSGYHDRPDSGSADVVYGVRGEGADLDLTNPQGRSLRIDGAVGRPSRTPGISQGSCPIGQVPSDECSGDEAGFSVGGGDDVTGDGVDDVILGASAADNRGVAAGDQAGADPRPNSGSAYVIPGIRRPSTPERPTPEQPTGEEQLGAAQNECLVSLRRPQVSVTHWKRIVKRRLGGKREPSGFFARLVVAPGAYSVLTDRATPVRVQTQRTLGSPKVSLRRVVFYLDGERIATREAPYNLLLRPGTLSEGTHTIAATVYPRKGKKRTLALKFRASQCDSSAFSASMIGKNVRKPVRRMELRVQSGGPPLDAVDFRISRYLKVRTRQLRRGRRIGTIELRRASGPPSRKALVVGRRTGRALELVASRKLKARLVPTRGGAYLKVRGLEGFDATMVRVTLDGRRTGLLQNPGRCVRHLFAAKLTTETDRLMLLRSLRMCKGKAVKRR